MALVQSVALAPVANGLSGSGGPSGTGFHLVAVGALVSLLVFGRDIGGTAILFLSWGDPVAEIVGRRWGRAGEGKTVVGSLGCLLACIVAGFVGVGLGGLSPWAVLVGAVVATLVERWSPPPNDNLWMPVLSDWESLWLKG